MFAPVIKWTGSKRSQAKEIISRFPRKIKTNYEPFLGSGAIMRAVMESGIEVEEYRCSDINNDLIRLWNDIITVPEQLATGYERLWLGLTGTDDDKTRKSAFYNNVRERFNREHDTVDFLFLLRTCANGMPRYNSRGEFNTSFHITRNGIRPDTLHSQLLEWNKLLKAHKVYMTAQSYDAVRTGEKDFLYLDPPYAATKGIYYGTINYEQFFRWLEEQQGGIFCPLMDIVAIRITPTTYQVTCINSMNIYVPATVPSAGLLDALRTASSMNHFIFESSKQTSTYRRTRRLLIFSGPFHAEWLNNNRCLIERA